MVSTVRAAMTSVAGIVEGTGWVGGTGRVVATTAEVVVVLARGLLVAPPPGAKIVACEDALTFEQPERAVDGRERNSGVDGMRASMDLVDIGVVCGL